MIIKTTFTALAFTALLIPLTAWYSTDAEAGLICHNGQCWDIGDIGDECCPFLFDSEFVSPLAALGFSTEQLSKIQPAH